MAEILILIALLLGVGFVLWRYENSSPICFEESQIWEKWSTPSYDPLIYSPLMRFPSARVRERFFLKVRLEELGCINVEVGQLTFKEAEKGKLVVVMYRVGRVTGQLRVIDLC